MNTIISYTAVVLFLTVAVASQTLPETLLTFQNHEKLDDDGKIVMGWEFDPETQKIKFELIAETTGFVGFGISSMGSMINADIYIAGVYPNGSSYSFVSFTRVE